MQSWRMIRLIALTIMAEPGKSETLNSKFETNSNDQSTNDQKFGSLLF